MPYANVNGIKLFYEERGEGDPLLLIMGITAPGSVWEKHANYWQQHYRCIQVDNRGVGFSDKPAGPYSTSLMADDYAMLLDYLEIPSAKVVGVSMGSTIAQQLALRHPQKVKSMVLMCPWARADRRMEAVFMHMMHAKKLKPEEFSNFIQFLIFHKSSWDHDETYRGFLESRQNEATNPYPQPLHGLEAQAWACINHNVLNELHKIKQKCLVIGGKEDIFVPEWMVREVAEAIPNCDLHLYEDAGHAFHWEKIDDFNYRVLDWLNQKELQTVV
jgi:pimeloyl-ACP methyl ester carboxylesterase